MSSRKAGLPFILVTLFLDILGIGLIIPIMPKLLGSFLHGNDEVTARYYGVFAACYAMMQLVFSPILGSLSDRFGRRKVLLLSTFGQGIDYLFLAMAPGLWWLFVGRIIAGITGASISTATAYIADITPPEKRAQNFGLVGAAFGLGFIVGPAVGGLLGHVNLHLPFFVASGLTLVNCTYGFFVLPESLPVENRRPFSWARANPFGTLKALSGYAPLVKMAGVVFLAQLGQFSLQTTWVLYTSHRYGWNEAMVGASLATVGISTAIVQGGLVRKIMPKLGEKRALLFGLMLSAVVFVAYGLAPQGWMVFVILPFGALAGLSGPAAQSLMSRLVKPSEQGMLQGGLSSLQSIGQVLGPLMATNLFSFFISDRAPVKIEGMAFFVAAVILLLGAALAALNFKQHPEFAAPVPNIGSTTDATPAGH